MHQHLIFTMTGFHLLVALLPVSLVLLYKWPNLWHYLLAVFLGALTGFLDQQSDDPQFAVLLLLVFGLFLGFSETKNAWRWAVILASWIPFFQFLKIILSGSFDNIISEGVFSLVAFVPAFLGTYTGVALRWAINRGQSTSPLQ